MTTKGRVFLAVLALLAAGVVAVLVLRPGERSVGRSPPESSPAAPPASPTTGDSKVGDEEPLASPGRAASSPAGARRDHFVWSGPDDAVESWYSQTCRREVLKFGVQQYAPGGQAASVPPGVSYLGYHLGDRQIWGDRGAPTTLYATADRGESFQEWFAVEDDC